MSSWDIVLVFAVSTQVLLVAYLFEPRWKALLLSLPFPFTFASLAVGEQVNAINVLSMVLMFLFMQSVRLLYIRLGMPIIISISLSILGYCVLGWMLTLVVPNHEEIFWISCALVFVMGIVLFKVIPVRQESGDRTTLPLWMKLPLTVLLVLLLVWGKDLLQGAITFFPMVGTFVAYEARKSLWTMGRQNTVIMMTMVPMVATTHLLHDELGLAYSLLVGWCVFLIGFGLVAWITKQQKRFKHYGLRKNELAGVEYEIER